MLKVKTITSKRQTDFEIQLARLLKSIRDSNSILEEIHYSIATDGKDICRSALIIYNTED